MDCEQNDIEGRTNIIRNYPLWFLKCNFMDFVLMRLRQYAIITLMSNEERIM